MTLSGIRTVAPTRPAAVWLAMGALVLGLAVDFGETIGLYSLPTTLDDVLYNGLLVGGGLLLAARAVHSAQERWAWGLLAVGVLLWAGGDIYWSVALAGLDAPPFPSWADALWLGFYVPALVGVALLAARRLGRLNLRAWLDGGIGALAIAGISAQVVFGAVADSTGGNSVDIAVNLAYPVADLILLGAIVAILVAARGFRHSTWWWLGAAMLTFVVVDSIYLYQVAAGTYVVGSPLDIGWPLAIMLMAWAAWQPVSATEAPSTVRQGGITMPLSLAGIALALLLYDHFERANLLAVGLAGLSLAVALVRLAATHRESRRHLAISNHHAVTDALTGLGNRRLLLEHLEAALAKPTDRPTLLLLFDLDGFKNYNDSFGHPAGDALLTRLATRLARSLPAGADAYRMGGDEFCALIPAGSETDRRVEIARAREALTEVGDGFRVGASAGYVTVTVEADTAPEALHIADQRLYADKNSGRVSPQRQSTDVLVSVLAERDGQLGEHMQEVAALAARVAQHLELSSEAVERVVTAAKLHDIGKAAIPDSILQKTGPLNHEEWEFIRRHTLIGERIARAAPALARVARIIRSSHERHDGGGYPDGLVGDEIPLESQIIFVCDAFDAMTATRGYAPALKPQAAIEELQRCAGSQFSPAMVDAFCAAYAVADAPPAPPELEPLAR